ncbi:MAG TPA: ABC transporter permease [Thermoplasmata archaeon]
MAVKDDLKTFKIAAWLGWQMESNWTDPFLFATYSIVRPIAGTLILVFMYLVITSGDTGSAFFSYMYVGNAFYMFVAEVLFGVTWVIHDDREHFMTLKQVYIAPIHFYTYVFGRAAIKIAIVSTGILITLAFGVAVLGVDIALASIDWPLFIISLVLGLIMLCVMGLAMGGLTFLTAKHEMGINEGVAGVFYVLSGVIFPITILPAWAQSVSMVLPVTYWMEALRRGLMPASMSEIAGGTGLEHLGNLELMGALALSATVFLLLSVAVFNYADKVARKKGKIDWTSAY